MLNTWEERIARKLHGRITEQGIWRDRTDQEPRELNKIPEPIWDIRSRNFKGLRHVIMVDQTKMGKKVVGSKLEGRRKLGSPDRDGSKMQRMIYES
jgi:hypothetical protein